MQESKTKQVQWGNIDISVTIHSQLIDSNSDKLFIAFTTVYSTVYLWFMVDLDLQFRQPPDFEFSFD